MAIDYIELEKALLSMKPRTKLFEIIKDEMKRRGRWKAAPKGKPFVKGFDERRNVRL